MKVRDLKSNVPLLFAEGRQTVKLMADTVKRLAEAYRAFRKGHFRKAAKILGIKQPPKTASNDWLAWQFGWLPLVSDLQGLAELAAQQLEAICARKPRFRVSSRVSMSLPVVTTNATGPNFGLFNIGMTSTARTTYDKRVVEGRAWLLVEVKPTAAALASQVGAGSIHDITALAWELIPFSFLFDYFIGVGQWLQDLGSLDGWTVLDGGYSLTHEWQETRIVTDIRRPGKVLRSQTGKTPSVVIKIRDYDRYKWDGGSNSIYVKGVDLLNARRLTNIAALGYQLASSPINRLG